MQFEYCMNENMAEEAKRINPFFEDYKTPHDTVPFDRIRLSDFEEAFMEGIRRDNEQIEKTINNPEKPTFDNTIINTEEDKDGYYDLLGRVSTVFFNLMSAETNDEMDALAQKIQPILTQHANDIRLNKKLFERIQYVHRHHRKLTPEEKMLLDNCYDGFVRSGALLDEEGKEKLRRLTEEASMLSLQFSQNLLKENKAFILHITDEKQLDGLPETAREAAALTAKEREMDGWVFTLDAPSYSPFMTYSTQRDLREKMYMARNSVCIHDNAENNLEICKRIVNLRREVAQLLGFRTYADYVLKHRMASKVKNVYRLLDDLIDAYKPTAKKEYAEIEKIAQKSEGKDFKMEPWDQGFYSTTVFRTVEGHRRCVRIGQQALWHYVQGEQGDSRISSRRKGLRGVRQRRLVPGSVLCRLPPTQGKAGRCLDDRIPRSVYRPQRRERPSSCERGDEPHQANGGETCPADIRRGGDIPA